MARSLLALFFLVATSTAFAQHDHAAAATAAKPSAQTALLPGMGNAHHPVSTSNPTAQKYFDEGLSLIYAFNHVEAEKAFKRAAELDPDLAMAHWGIAVAVGPNYNLPVDEAREVQAYNETQKALKMKASPSEHAYIEALATRYIAEPHGKDLKPLDLAYRDAMRKVSEQYPDDLDAATLFAESGMNINPWKLHHADGTPAEGTEEIISTLESVMRRDPNHMGAIHYYIHAVEASNHPERALEPAMRLAALAPGAGHLVHMPAHIYIRTGDFESAAATNEKAVAADNTYMKETGTYKGIYPSMYYAHNVHFLAMAYSMSGQYALAIQRARDLNAHSEKYVKDMPMMQGFMSIEPMVLVRFHKWDEILKQPAPTGTDIRAINMHFARAIAYAAKKDMANADKEKEAFEAARAKMPTDIPVSPVGNLSGQVMEVSDHFLQARLAEAAGDHNGALQHWKEAVMAEDKLSYAEPRDFFIPVRESLGAALYNSGDYAGAEKVFREDLANNQRNGRSLFGLAAALKAQHKDYDAAFVQKQFDEAWKKADTKLSMSDL
jgi:tetratricopeptide (TPR) repeat protein